MELGHQRQGAAFGLIGAEAVFEPKLGPAQARKPVVFQQVTIAGWHGGQLDLEPELLLGDGPFGHGFPGRWRGQVVEQAPGVTLLAWLGSIQAEHLEGLVHGFGCFQLGYPTAQSFGECPKGAQLQTLLALELQQALCPLVQFPQAPWGFEGLLVIAQVVQHRPADVGHGKAAQGSIALEIEGFHRPDQAHVASGHQFLKAVAAAVVQTVGHLAHQGQVVDHHRIAPVQPALVLFGCGHRLEPLTVTGAQLLGIGGGEGHGTGGNRAGGCIRRTSLQPLQR